MRVEMDSPMSAVLACSWEAWICRAWPTEFSEQETLAAGPVPLQAIGVL
jgi:hypothetical protein